MNTILKSQEQGEGMGARVRRSIGTAKLRNFDPFLMLDEMVVTAGIPAGFPDHPHRGFETVTYMIEGTFEHEDFEGHKGRIGPGDLQWMTAGRGIVHAEMPACFEEDCRGLQLWVNLPAKDKMVAPRYQELFDKDIPRVKTSDESVSVKVIAGESMGASAKVRTYTPIYYLDFEMKPHSKFEQHIPSDYNGFIYTLEGSAYFGKNRVKGDAHNTLTMEKDGDTITFETEDQGSRFVLIAGKPIAEPIYQHGPFVMNTREEIMQTFLDYEAHRNGFEKAANWESTIGKKNNQLH